MTLNDMIRSYYSQQRYGEELLTCYTHLQCNRGSIPVCLDWTEICDEKIDCMDEVDEKDCWPLMYDRCDNGQCVPSRFVRNVPHFEDLDRSDELGNEYNAPTVLNEDTVCSWRERSGKQFLFPHTSSCRAQRQKTIEQAMFADKLELSLGDKCFLAFQCYSNISADNDLRCATFCQNETCTRIIKDMCPAIVYYPSVPIAFGHIYFAYTIEYIMHRKGREQLFPEYICYNDQLCGGFSLNATVIRLRNSTCRHPEDFPLSVSYNGIDWHSTYIQLIYTQLGHCSQPRMYHNFICDSSNMYQCKNSSKCIPISYVGDGIRDCDYYDDEDQSTIDQQCPTGQTKRFFYCRTNKKCIHRNQVKDGICDCPMDEYGMCDDEKRDFHQLQQAIIFAEICDRSFDLRPMIINGQSHTDETNCEHWPCNNTYTRCDGFWTCPDGADEVDCHRKRTHYCPHYHHRCISASTYQWICLPIDKANDGRIDCLGGIDEPMLCPVKNRQEKSKFYCKSVHSGICLSAQHVCDKVIHCENGDDERLCNTTMYNSLWNNLLSSNRNFDESILSKSASAQLSKSKGKKITAQFMSMISKDKNYCNRGLPLRVVLNSQTNVTRQSCLCPPSYYGDYCQYQSQRVSITMNITAPARSRQTLFVLVVLLLDDTSQRLAHSYEQLSYLHVRDKDVQYNFYLLYSTRPKDAIKQYFIHIDIYEKTTLHYKGSKLIRLQRPFLPVERVLIRLNIPHIHNIIQTCSNEQHGYGHCLRYLDDPSNATFYQCDQGWIGRNCNIRYNGTCRSDSLCAGATTTYRSICVCPSHKFGSQCFLTKNSCQHNPCSNRSVCIPADERSTSQPSYVCICPEGFHGERCEIPDYQIILILQNNLTFSSQQFVHFYFIYFFPNGKSLYSKKSTRICVNQTSVIGYSSYPLHITLVELAANQYYLISNKKGESPVALVYQINLSNRCRSISEIFSDNITRMPVIQRLKYYHLPCQNRSSNLSCFYDEVHMCLCSDFGDSRLANCHQFKYFPYIGDLELLYHPSERVCPEDYLSNSSLISMGNCMPCMYIGERFLDVFILLFYLHIFHRIQ
ncbi:unnamed protein product [Adineta ricciae]|uniref:EGF-like domain-containing protein n=1 Tax=Adineta ricciae TaxID=249248 RepID=A0A815SPV7_ADIRI|nr:unnamed protein product [Adineta ricciae]